MNIFFLDYSPKKAAQLQCDKHVVKMLLESAQLLSTVNHKKGNSKDWMYKKTHANHPCTLWVEESEANYRWLWLHASYLCEEYTYRWGKTHKSEEIIKKLCTTPYSFDKIHPTNPPCVMPEDCIQGELILSYRYYYKRKSEEMNMTWKKRTTPTFLSHAFYNI